MKINDTRIGTRCLSFPPAHSSSALSPILNHTVSMRRFISDIFMIDPEPQSCVGWSAFARRARLWNVCDVYVQRRRTIDTSDQRMKNNIKNTIINTKLVRWAMQWNGKNMLLIKLHEARIRACNYALRLLGICCARQRGKMQMTDATPELRTERIFAIDSVYSDCRCAARDPVDGD